MRKGVNLDDLTAIKVREALQRRMKQQHEREWGNTHASPAAAAAAAVAVWRWTAISRLPDPTSCYVNLSPLLHKFPVNW